MRVAPNNALNYRSLRSLDSQKLRFCSPVSLIVRHYVKMKFPSFIILLILIISGCGGTIQSLPPSGNETVKVEFINTTKTNAPTVLIFEDDYDCFASRKVENGPNVEITTDPTRRTYYTFFYSYLEFSPIAKECSGIYTFKTAAHKKYTVYLSQEKNNCSALATTESESTHQQEPVALTKRNYQVYWSWPGASCSPDKAFKGSSSLRQPRGY